uniref:Uncharacterized protein n=1 Tax=Arundo donax TaxID=35708 RepID=A0A0A9D039_ARUDO
MQVEDFSTIVRRHQTCNRINLSLHKIGFLPLSRVPNCY